LTQFKQWLTASVREVEPNVFAAAPPPALPLRYETAFLLLSQQIKLQWLHQVIRHLNFQKPIVWFFSPDCAPIVGKLNEQVTVFSLTDDYPTSPFLLNRRSQVQHWHNRLIEESDLIITTASSLVDKYRSLNANIHYVPHGVEYELFSQALMPQPMPEDMSGIFQPQIGFVGRVNERIDTGLITALAEKRPNWSFVFVGPVDHAETLNMLNKLPNTFFLGRKPLDQLPQYLSSMAACIIPYTLTEHTQHMHPLKALEYLAAGKAVVSTALPTLQIHEGYISFAADAAAFVAALDNELTTDTPEDRQRRSDYTRQHDWMHQLEKICTLIDSTRHRNMSEQGL
jgi:UDP-galactopyranose mutase